MRTLLVCSFRYALGRRTYITQDVAGLVLTYRGVLNEHDVKQMIEGVENAVEHGLAGSYMDVVVWEDMVYALKTGRDA